MFRATAREPAMETRRGLCCDRPKSEQDAGHVPSYHANPRTKLRREPGLPLEGRKSIAGKMFRCHRFPASHQIHGIFLAPWEVEKPPNCRPASHT